MKTLVEIFDSEKEKPLELSFLIHSNSFFTLSEIEHKKLNWFIEFNYSENVRIELTPSNKSEIIKILKAHHLIPSIYKIFKNQLIVEKKDDDKKFYSGHPIIINPPEEKFINKNCNLTNYDLLYFQSSDYNFFIVSEAEYTNIKKPEQMIITLDTAFLYLRLFFLKNNILLIAPNTTSGYFLYYLYRHARTFALFQKLWSIAVDSKNKKRIESLQSIDTRLTFILKAIDVIEYTLFSSPTLDNKSNLIYHFSYLNILLTGVLDDFAWIFLDQFRLDLKNKVAVSLRVKQKKEKSEFSKCIRTQNENIANFIEDKSNKKIINLIYTIRDKVQHQDFIKVIETQSFLLCMKNIDTEDIDLDYIININIIKKEIKHDKVSYYLIPNEYIKIIKSKYYLIINTLLSFIDLQDFIKKIDQKKMDEINNQYNLFLNKPWEFYNLHSMPTLLESEYLK